jgi:hypothetical protein
LLPVILINIAWYWDSNGESDAAGAVSLLIVVLSLYDLLIAISATIGGEKGSTAYDLHQLYNVWWWLPLIVLALNLLFILVYYTVGKRTCKIIYRMKKEEKE